MLFGVAVAILVGLTKQVGWKARAETLLDATPFLEEIGGYETMSVRSRKDLLLYHEPRRKGASRDEIEGLLEANGFQEPESCGWIESSPFDDLSNHTTCYLRTVEFGNCDAIYLVAAKYDDSENLIELTGSHFTLQVC